VPQLSLFRSDDALHAQSHNNGHNSGYVANRVQINEFDVMKMLKTLRRVLVTNVA